MRDNSYIKFGNNLNEIKTCEICASVKQTRKLFKMYFKINPFGYFWTDGNTYDF